MPTLSEIQGERRTTLVTERDALLAVEPQNFTPENEARAEELNAQIKDLDERIAESRAAEARDIEARKFVAEDRAHVAQTEVVSEPNPVYRKGGTEHSFFRDLAQMNTNVEARERLAKSQETRALTTVAAAGGTFAPPLWLAEDYIALARSARVTADLLNKQPLPAGVSSINLPKVSTGTAVGITETQATAITQTDLATTSVSSNITTIVGGQTVANQLLHQSGVPMDDVVLSDLAMAAASALDVQVINGSNAAGQLKGLITAGTTVTYTTSAPLVVSSTAAASFYNKVVKGIAAMANSRFLPADTIVMTPNRWAWILQSLDSNIRLQVAANGAGLNAPAVAGAPVAEGFAGTLAGLPVYIDPNIPADRGVATNQDVVLILRRGDHWLYETPLEQASFDATYAASNATLFRVTSYAALVTRHAASAQIVDGTGLVAPTL